MTVQINLRTPAGVLSLALGTTDLLDSMLVLSLKDNELLRSDFKPGQTWTPSHHQVSYYLYSAHAVEKQ